MKREKFRWFRVALQIRGSVIPAIFNRVLYCGLFGVFLCYTTLSFQFLSQFLKV